MITVRQVTIKEQDLRSLYFYFFYPNPSKQKSEREQGP